MVLNPKDGNLDTKEIAKKTQLTEKEVIDIIKKRDM